MGKKEEQCIKISHKLELLIWLLLVLFFVSINTFTTIFKEKNDGNDYQIFLQDIDGLIVGSPVRMMGVEVGHVKKIKPINNEIYVKFILTNPATYLPPGTVATVEFTGLAGSKSLELYLPEKAPIGSVLINITEPKRLHDAMGLLNDMFKKISSIIYTSSSFGDKLNNINLDLGKGANLREFLDYSADFIDNSQQKINVFNKNINEVKNDKQNGRKIQ